MVGKGNLAVFESSDTSETRDATPTKIGVHACYINACLHEFFEPILFFTPMDYIVHGLKGKFGRFEGKQKRSKSPKPEMPHPPKLVCMRFRPTSACMSFLSQFYFLTSMDYTVQDDLLARN